MGRNSLTQNRQSDPDAVNIIAAIEDQTDELLAAITCEAIQVTIGAGASLSGVSVDLAGKVVVAVKPDAAWDTNAVTFQAGNDVTVTNLRYDGAEYTLSGVVASNFEAVDPRAFLAARFIKVRSGTSAAPVNQVDATVITLYVRPL